MNEKESERNLKCTIAKQKKVIKCLRMKRKNHKSHGMAECEYLVTNVAQLMQLTCIHLILNKTCLSLPSLIAMSFTAANFGSITLECMTVCLIKASCTYETKQLQSGDHQKLHFV